MTLITLIGLLHASAPPVAMAQQDAEQLRALVDQANAAMDRGDFEAARQANMRGYELTEDPIWLHNASVCLWAEQRHAEALALSDEVLEQALELQDAALYQTHQGYRVAWQTTRLAQAISAAPRPSGVETPQQAALSPGGNEAPPSRFPVTITAIGAGMLVGALAVNLSMTSARLRFDELSETAATNPSDYAELQDLRKGLVLRQNVGLGLGFASVLFLFTGGMAWWRAEHSDAPALSLDFSAPETGRGVRASFTLTF